jgi:hypothetical protein
MDLTAEGPSNDRFIGPINHDKWSTIEEKLRAVKKMICLTLSEQLKYVWC